MSIIGFLVAGFTEGNLAITWGVSLGLMFIVLLCITMYQKKNSLQTRTMNVEDNEVKKEVEVEMEDLSTKPEGNDIDTLK